MHEAMGVIENRKIQTVMENLRKNRMEAFFAETAADARAKVREMIREGAAVSAGGSVTLEEAGILAMLRGGNYRFLDRNAPGLDAEQVRRIYRDTFGADVFVTSANAVTMNGELYNVDGRSNRIAAIAYGPESVIVVAGINKIVPDVPAAIERVRLTAAPANCVRLGKKTYCAAAGRCEALGEPDMTAGCKSPDRICSNYLVSAMQSLPGRIKVILVGEPLGF